MQDIADALADPHFKERGLFDRRVVDGEEAITAIPVPIAPQFRNDEKDAGYPKLGDANDLLPDEGT